VLRTCVIAWFVAGLLALAGCTSGGVNTAASADHAPLLAPTTATTQPRLLPGHVSWIETFVDKSRPTVPTAGARLPSRTLVTAIYRPNGAGPFPLVMFSHGLDGHPQKFTKLFSEWADAGFAIAAPAFPLTNSHAADPNSNVGDVEQQPADVSFVLDKVLALNKQPKSRLFHAIDERKIGAGGLSLGGLTTYLLAYDECCRDQRVRAVEVLDGIRPDVTLDGHVPLLIAHSDTDPLLPYSAARDAYTAASGPAWFVTLHGAAHASQWEDDVTPYDHIAGRITIDFWAATLNGDVQAFTRLRHDATVPNLSSIVAKDTTHGVRSANGTA
jgi:dienelactone hydrolase